MRAHRFGRTSAGLAAAVTIAGLLAAGGPALAASASAGSSTGVASASSGGPAGLTGSQALSHAKASGHSVIATALTTDRSQTTANPDGTFTVTQSLMPVRAFRGGQWQNLDATLRQSGHSVTPAVSDSPLSLSAGGTGPLAVMTAVGRTLSLYWPTPLPAPSIAGSTATYGNVLPGVDLAVTADALGGISETLIIRTPAAAANPALAAISLRAVASPGLHLVTDAAGDLAVTAGGNAQPAFTAQAPLMWDSAPPPAGLATVTNAAGVLVSAGSGLPADSSAAAPGAGADVTRVPVTVSSDSITLAPPTAALGRPAADFPLYIDPSFHDAVGGKASSWTQVDSGFPTTTYWKESSDLQLGFCDFSGCNGLGVARSFFTLPISSALTGAVITGSNVYVNDVWSASCTAEPVQLWTTSGITSSTNWNTQTASGFWKTDVQSQSYAYGYSGCDPGGHVVGYDVTSVVKADAGHSASQTFGIKAGNEGNDLQWKQFASGASNLTISTSYYFKPNQPASPTANGGCGTSASPNVIGNDDVTFKATASDKDGDPSLTTTFTIWNSAGTSKDTFAVTTGENVAATSTVSRTTIAGWNASGGVYHWSAVTTDENNAAGPVSTTCYFDWNPNAPAAPGVAVSPATQVIGQPVTITITPPNGCSATTNPCPTTYSYQLGPETPSTVAVGSGTCTSTSCPVTVTVNQLGPITISVTGIANTNTGQTNSGQVVNGCGPGEPGCPAGQAYADGYFSGGTYPDVLTVGTGSKPSLWLSPGTGNGTVGPAVDIGSLGTGIPAAGATGDGPGDWAGAQVLHGNFTGSGVQDVIAYYPTGASAGNGSVIFGSGDAYTLNSTAGNDIALSGGLTDQQLSATDVPIYLVAAGNASQQGNGLDDLIGILGDPTSGYELNLYTTSPGLPGNYNLDTTLSLTSQGGPDGNPWNDFRLATAQPGGNSSDVVLFALDTTNGQLWESQNTGCPANCAAGPVVGTTGTWTQLTGTLPATLTSADINQRGQIELWSVSAGAIAAYAVTGSQVSEEASQSSGASLSSQVTDDWPLTDGACDSSTPASAVDTVTGTSATIAGAFSWACDNTLGTDLNLSTSGGGGYLTPPASTIPLSATGLGVSLWFRTSSPSGVLASLQKQAVSGGGTVTGYYDPVLYIGSDGRLWGQWYDSPQQPVESRGSVDDGLWHHAVLTATPSGSAVTETLYLDGKVQGAVTNTFHFTSTWSTATNLTFGTGYLGGSWPDESHSGGNGTLTYYNGSIAAITLPSGGSLALARVTGAPATFNPVTGAQDLYAAGTNGTEFQNSQGSSGGWSGWANISGLIGSNSSALFNPASGNIEVYAKATSGDLEEDYWRPSGGWSGWASMGVTTAYPPCAVYDPLDNAFEVYETGTTGTTFVDSWTPAGGWSGWKNIGGVLTTAPAAAYDAKTGSMQVFGVGTTGAGYVNSWTPSSGWSGWVSLGGVITATPSVIFDQASGTMEVYGRGSTGEVYEDYLTSSGSWSGWTSEGAVSAYGPAAVYDPLDNALEVYETGSTNGPVSFKSWTSSGGWSSWVNLGATLSGPPVPVYDPASGNMEVFGLESGGTYIDSWNPAGGWSGWTSIGPVFSHL